MSPDVVTTTRLSTWSFDRRELPLELACLPSSSEYEGRLICCADRRWSGSVSEWPGSKWRVVRTNLYLSTDAAEGSMSRWHVTVDLRVVLACLFALTVVLRPSLRAPSGQSPAPPNYYGRAPYGAGSHADGDAMRT